MSDASPMGFDLDTFSIANRARCEAPDGFNHPLDSWSLSDWMMAALGELGEAANVGKKLNRVRDGIVGNKETPDELRAKFGRELADAVIYIDLLAQRQGLRLSDLVRETFDAKSEQIGYPVRLAAGRPDALPGETATVAPDEFEMREGDVLIMRRNATGIRRGGTFIPLPPRGAPRSGELVDIGACIPDNWHDPREAASPLKNRSGDVEHPRNGGGLPDEQWMRSPGGVPEDA